MLSSEISDLENFIDSYVGPDKAAESPQNWSRTHSYESIGYPDSFGGANNHRNYSPAAGDGTEVWGKRQAGKDWNMTLPRQEWTDHRPQVQERPPQQWQQQITSEVQHGYPGQWAGQGFQDIPENGHNPNHIQAVVSDLIRQNNMNKPPQNLPSWVDVTQPPPPFPTSMTPPMHFSNTAREFPHGNEVMGQEPILQSMTFQRSPNRGSDQVVPAQMPMVNNIGYVPNSVNSQSDGWVEINSQYHPNLQASSMQWPAQPYYEQAMNSFPIQASHVDAPDFNAQILQGGLFEQPNALVQADLENTRPPPLNNFSAKTLNNPNAPPADERATKKTTEQKQEEVKRKTPNSNRRRERFSPKELEAQLFEKTMPEKYPNSKLRRSSSKSDDSDTHKSSKPSNKSHSRQNSEEVFENDWDDRWKTHNIQVQISNKKTNLKRRPSAADDDPDWRRRNDSENSSKQPTRHYSRHSSADNDAKYKPSPVQSKGNREKRESPNTGVSKDVLKSDKSSRRSREKSDDKDQTKHDYERTDEKRKVAEKSKSKVHAWIEGGKKHSSDSVGQEIHRLQITDSEADLTKFIEMTQAFATTESKMREVADILCNKALKNPKFAKNASILCDRMAWMMVQGTKFRTVVLNVMQGHFKNREQLYSASFRSDRRWYGFAAFLVEIFLNVRTSTREKLVVLISPVFSCLFQILTGDKIDQEHIECFGRLFLSVGPSLEAESPQRMNELMGEIRDRLVISKTASVKRVLLSCVEHYACKWNRNGVTDT
ncbi:unnamed protein product [Clavelina lepadiformis]|uniref:MIF4G domain-containing protein n=1 Tax=Clavelina lepadiformis TaxID=159417 RepID=A0ABP0FQB9_CLALP